MAWGKRGPRRRRLELGPIRFGLGAAAATLLVVATAAPGAAAGGGGGAARSGDLSGATASAGGGRTCFQPDATGPEQYGPTDISAVTGNRRLTVAENGAGTLTLMRWPSPSYDNQLRYRTVSAHEPGYGVAPNQGSFLGVVVAGKLRWLRDLAATQTELDASSDAVTTNYGAPGLDVQVVDVVDAQRDALVRRVEVRPAGAASAVVGFAHFDPTTVHYPDFPTWDWCQQDLIASSASYRPADDAVVTAAEGVGLAVGFAAPSSTHQVGQDAYWSGQHLVMEPADAYDTSNGSLPAGSPSAPGPQVDLALSTPLDTGGGATFVIAAGTDTDGRARRAAGVRAGSQAGEGRKLAGALSPPRRRRAGGGRAGPARLRRSLAGG